MGDLGPIRPGDPRIFQSFAIGLATEGTATSVLLQLKPFGSKETKALNVMTPAEARDMAYKLWDAAKKADDAMNAVLQPKEGK